MSISTYRSISTRETPQSEPIPGERQIKNAAGGYVYEISKWDTFLRFLILGSEGGSYYISEKKLTKDNALNVFACVNEDGRRAVDLIVDVSDRGRAPKNDPAIFALAIAAAAKDPDTRKYALSKLSKVCRIPTHLFHFITFVKQFRGMGRGLRRAIADWYTNMPVDKLAYELVKYQSRDGWSNRDVLRVSHPETSDKVRNAVFRWAVGANSDRRTLTNTKTGQLRCYAETVPLPEIISAFEALKNETSTARIVDAIHKYGLTREMIPTQALTKVEVWEALLDKMPMTAMIRNLGNMSKVGLLKPMSDAAKTVSERLRNMENLKKARVHPASILVAMRTYAEGRGMLGSGTWTVVPSVVDALDDALQASFDFVEPTGKRIIYGVDVSGSMAQRFGGLPISSAEAAAVLALVCARTEQEYYIMGFTNGFTDLGITAKSTFLEACSKAIRRNFGSTDCALPMKWALDNGIKADAFVVITDNDTWSGRAHPKQALSRYREKMGIMAKQVVIATSSVPYSIADPSDPLAVDMVGFDTSTPAAAAAFIGM